MAYLAYALEKFPQETTSVLQAIDAAAPSTWRRAFALAGPALGAQWLGLLVNLTGRWLAGNADTASASGSLIRASPAAPPTMR